MTIDFHTHIFPPRIKEHREEYLRRDAGFAELYSSPTARIITAEELISSMDSENIAAAVVLNIGWRSHQLCIETNDYIMESAARYPGRLYGFCALQPMAAGAITELERCIRGGIRGIGELRPDSQGFDLGSLPLMSNIAELAEEHNLCLLTHASEPVGHQYSGKGKTTPDIIYQFAMNFPRVHFICAHWGGGLPFYALMPEVAAVLKNTYFDTAASPFLYQPDIYEYIANIIGSDKILFGSDYPLLPQSRVILQIQRARLTEDAKNAILTNNAQKLLHLIS